MENYKQIIVIILLLSIPIIVLGQGFICGHIEDVNSLVPLKNVKICLWSTINNQREPITVKTDSLGFYLIIWEIPIQELKEVIFTTSKVGYEFGVLKIPSYIKIENGTVVNFRLKKAKNKKDTV